MTIHGMPPATPAAARIFQVHGGVSVEVFETAFHQETRDLANECFSRYHRARGRDLDWDTPNADREARGLLEAEIRSTIHRAKDGDAAWVEHLRDLAAEIPPVGRDRSEPEYQADGALAHLWSLAIDGPGRRPAASTRKATVKSATRRKTAPLAAFPDLGRAVAEDTERLAAAE